MYWTDIAKTAVQRAAKLNAQVTWVVGTGATLPVLDQSIDICTSLFSPIPKDEILRALKPKGYLLVVTPAPEHLYALREALFDEVKPHQPNKFVEQLQSDFELVLQQHVESQFDLDQDQLKNLIAMTPYAYKAKPEKDSNWNSKPSLNLQRIFKCIFSKRNKAILKDGFKTSLTDE
jgi:23S rRNA (guanine745-N1)-methyltransferase